MSRSESHYGLNERGEKIVEGEKILSYYKKEIRLYPNEIGGGFTEKSDQNFTPIYKSSVRQESSGIKYGGVFEEECPLMHYVFTNGDTYTEFVQEEIWDSGPCFFLALKDERNKVIQKSLWTKKEINEILGIEVK